MIFTIAAAMAMCATGQAGPVQLGRIFEKGEKLQYSVKASLKTQLHTRGLEQWIPSDFDVSYKFTLETVELKPDGIAIVRYLRPTMTTVEGETFESGPKTVVIKPNLNLLLTRSAINETIAIKDETPRKKTGGVRLSKRRDVAVDHSVQMDIGGFVDEIQGLCLAVRADDSGLDLAPKLPLDKVKVGDSWKRTVAYEPQKLKGAEGKQVVQRLDFTFVYKGIVDSAGKKVHRITATLNLDTDLGDFYNQAKGQTPDESGIKKAPLTMSGSVDFDLDLTTMRTIAATFNSQGAFKVFTVDDTNDPTGEEKFVGKTQLTLVGRASG